MSKDEDWNINDWIKTAPKAEDRAMLRRALANIHEMLDVEQISKRGGVYLRMTHRPTGITVERKCGASQSDAYLDTFDELLDKLPPEWHGDDDFE
jgi:hypothetical protein